jgi:hypothetical protein
MALRSDGIMEFGVSMLTDGVGVGLEAMIGCVSGKLGCQQSHPKLKANPNKAIRQKCGFHEQFADQRDLGPNFPPPMIVDLPLQSQVYWAR